MTELNSYRGSAVPFLFFLPPFSLASINFIRTPLVCGTLKVGKRGQRGRGWTIPRAPCERIAGEATGGEGAGRAGAGEEDGVKGSSPRQFVVKSELIF